MIQSMTAFARVQKQVENASLSWEIRSVNHRYLDVSFRLPEAFRQLEPNLRAELRDKIGRGKLECQLKYQNTSADNQSMLIDIGMVNALLAVGAKLSASHGLADDLSVSKVLSWPGIVQAQQPDLEELAKEVMALFSLAINQLVQTRTAEGQELKALIEGRLQALVSEVENCRHQVKRLGLESKEKLLARLKSVQMEVSEVRLEQELALLIARQDVQEELDRLHTHCSEVSRTLKCDKVAGRRLDFLMQELNREANTLTSKSDSIELTQSAVEMKVLIEQMREQIQNIE